VEVLSGSRSIGGNFIKITDGDKSLVFDQGIRFDIMKRYYSFMVSPTGLAELRSLGVLPKPEWYRDAQDIYITHMHLDHLGALSNIPSEATVHVPSIATYELMEEKWRMSPTWLNLVPRKYYVSLEEIVPFEVDQNGVEAIPVSHSAFPAYAYLYHGSDETVLYTGDFRVEGYFTEEDFRAVFGGPFLLDYFKEYSDVRVDTLIIEGTNIGSSRAPMGPDETASMHGRIMESSSVLLATLHPLDLEYAVILTRLGEEKGKVVYTTSSEIYTALEKLPQFPSILLLDEVSLDMIEPNSLVLTSYREVLDLMRTLADETCKETSVIISEPEPSSEEMSETDIIGNWAASLGIQHYRIRVSGHYYPYQLKEIIAVFKPKRAEAVHTEKQFLARSLLIKHLED